MHTYLVIPDGIKALQGVSSALRDHHLNVDESWTHDVTGRTLLSGGVLGINIAAGELRDRRSLRYLEEEIAEKIEQIAGQLAAGANVLLVLRREEEHDISPRKLFSRLAELLASLSVYIESEHGISVSINALDLRPNLTQDDVTKHVLDIVLRRSVFSRGVVISSDDLGHQSLRNAILGDRL